MKTTTFSVCLVLGLMYSFRAQSQIDTIHMRGRLIPCTVTAIGANTISYKHPGEDAIYALNKAQVEKVSFRNGRIETFPGSNRLAEVTNGNDHKNVALLGAETETQGLYRIGAVTAKAKGFTFLTGLVKLQERALHKLQIRAAMLGGNALLLTEQNSIPHNSVSFWGLSSYSLQSGIVYTTNLPDAEAFLKKIEEKQVFKLSNRSIFDDNATKLTAMTTSGRIEIHRKSIEIRDGALFFKGTFTTPPAPSNYTIPAGKIYLFRLVHFDDNSFTLYFESSNRNYNNIKLLFEEK